VSLAHVFANVLLGVANVSLAHNLNHLVGLSAAPSSSTAHVFANVLLGVANVSLAHVFANVLLGVANVLLTCC